MCDQLNFRLLLVTFLTQWHVITIIFMFLTKSFEWPSLNNYLLFTTSVLT